MVIAGLLAVAGCGSDDSGGSSTDTTTTEGSTGTTADPGSTGTTGGAGQDPGSALTLTSSAFADDEVIPSVHACEDAGGDGISPPLAWSGVPDEAATLVLVVHDPDAPIEGGFTHLVTAFDPSVTSFETGAAAAGGPMAAWIPMCPPDGEHRYLFTLYAFGPGVEVPADATKDQIDDLAPEALAETTLTGRFARP